MYIYIRGSTCTILLYATPPRVVRIYICNTYIIPSASGERRLQGSDDVGEATPLPSPCGKPMMEFERRAAAEWDSCNPAAAGGVFVCVMCAFFVSERCVRELRHG